MNELRRWVMSSSASGASTGFCYAIKNGYAHVVEADGRANAYPLTIAGSPLAFVDRPEGAFDFSLLCGPAPGMVELPEPEDGQQWALVNDELLSNLEEWARNRDRLLGDRDLRWNSTAPILRLAVEFCELNPGLVSEPEPVITAGSWAEFPETTQGSYFVQSIRDDDMVVWNLGIHGTWAGFVLSAAEKLPSMRACDPPACAQVLYNILGFVQPGGEA